MDFVVSPKILEQPPSFDAPNHLSPRDHIQTGGSTLQVVFGKLNPPNETNLSAGLIELLPAMKQGRRNSNDAVGGELFHYCRALKESSLEFL
jgi:hypothetical protein